METENPYVEQPERVRYDANRSASDRLRAQEAAKEAVYVRPMSERLLLRAAYAEGVARRVRESVSQPSVATQVYRASQPVTHEVVVAMPVSLDSLLPRPVA